MEPSRSVAGPQIQLGQDSEGDHRGLRIVDDRHNRRAMSRVAVVGAGYVGLTTAACLADLGNEVCVVDIDHEKIRALRRSRLHFYEPGLQEIVERNGRAGRLRFTTAYEEAIPGAEFAFIAV